MLRRGIVLYYAMLIFYGEAIAQRPSSLTIDQAVEQALARAPELKAAQENERANAARIKQARAAYWPRLNAEASYSFHSPINELPIQIPTDTPLPFSIAEIDDYHRVRAGVQAGLRVLDFSRSPRLNAAKKSLESEQARTRETAASIAFQVRVAFLTALYAREVKQMSRESLNLALAEEERAKLRVQVGTGSQVALAQARVRVAGLRAQLRQAENEWKRQRELLANFIGIDQTPEVVGDLRMLAKSVPTPSLEKTPALVRLRAAEQSAQSNALSISRNFVPTFSLMARVDYEYPHAMYLEWGPLYQAGVNLAWDFYDSGLRQGQVQEAQAQARSLAETYRATEQQLKRKLIDLTTKLHTAQADLISAQEILEQSEIYLSVARAALAAGTGTELEVHTAELGLDRAQLSVQQALLAQALARAELLLAYGITSESIK